MVALFQICFKFWFKKGLLSYSIFSVVVLFDCSGPKFTNEFTLKGSLNQEWCSQLVHVLWCMEPFLQVSESQTFFLLL